MMRRYGHGNGPTRQRTLRANRRTAEMVRTTDVRDVGIRPDVGEAFGFGDPRSFGDDVEATPPTYFAWLVFRAARIEAAP